MKPEKLDEKISERRTKTCLSWFGSLGYVVGPLLSIKNKSMIAGSFANILQHPSFSVFCQNGSNTDVRSQSKSISIPSQVLGHQAHQHRHEHKGQSCKERAGRAARAGFCQQSTARGMKGPRPASSWSTGILPQKWTRLCHEMRRAMWLIRIDPNAGESSVAGLSPQSVTTFAMRHRQTIGQTASDGGEVVYPKQCNLPTPACSHRGGEHRGLQLLSYAPYGKLFIFRKCSRAGPRAGSGGDKAEDWNVARC